VAGSITIEVLLVGHVDHEVEFILQQTQYLLDDMFVMPLAFKEEGNTLFQRT
jgi:hypothetical protein